MVTKEEFKVLVKGMKAVYTQPTFLPDGACISVWYEMLKDLDYEELSKAIHHHMQTCKFQPTIADIRENALKYKAPSVQQMNEQEAWARVRKAISNSTYHADEEFKKLPPILQKAVGSPDSLRQWAVSPVETVESVEASHFIKVFRTLKETANEYSRIQPILQANYALGIGSSNNKQKQIGDSVI